MQERCRNLVCNALQSACARLGREFP